MAEKNIRTGNISQISGEVNIAAGNIIRNIRTIYQRSLTAAEEAEKARSLENKLLADGVSSYIQRLQIHAKIESESSSPYKGLLEYRLAEAEFFYGRKRATQSLLKTMARDPLTILHAESGAGKTSLLQAGIMPRLLVHGHLPLYLRPYDRSPSIAIKEAFLPNLDQSPILAQTTLRDFLARVVNILGKNSVLFIMIDQFEEFFIRVEEKEQATFVNELGECLDDKSLNVGWLLSLRSEYFGRLANFRPRIQTPYENDFLLNPLTRDEAFEAITNPIEKYQIKFEPGLAEKILDDLGKDQIAPPQLQLVCSALYEALEPAEKLLTTEIYELREGSATGILRGHLERVLKRLTPDGRVAARQVLEALITSVQQRVLRPRDELFQSLSARGLEVIELQRTIEQLVENRLLRVEESDDGPAYELAHDYLLDEIKLDPEVVKRKQAEELLEQGIKNWNSPQRILLGEDVLAVIQSREKDLIIEGRGNELLFWSAVRHNKNLARHASKLTEEQRQGILQEIQNDGSRPIPRTEKDKALWTLRKDIPFLETTGAGVRQGLRWIWRHISILILVFIVTLVLALVLQFLEGETSVASWQKLVVFDAQCLAGKQSVNPVGAINVAHSSDMVAYDPQARTMCTSHDEGKTWSNVPPGLPKDLSLTSISFNRSLILIASKRIFIQKEDDGWQEIILPEQYRSEEPSAVAQPITDPRHIFVGMKSGLVIHSTNLGKAWEPFEFIPTDDLQTLSSNGIYIVAATPTKIYFRKISNGTWESFNPKQETPIHIRAAIMLTPILDSMIVLTEDGIVLDGFLENDDGLRNINSKFYPAHIETIAAYQSHRLIGNHQGLHSLHSCTFFDWEWWFNKC